MVSKWVSTMVSFRGAKWISQPSAVVSGSWPRAKIAKIALELQLCIPPAPFLRLDMLAKSNTLQTKIEAPKTPLEDLVPFT